MIMGVVWLSKPGCDTMRMSVGYAHRRLGENDNHYQ
jgi:hypothetical protein